MVSCPYSMLMADSMGSPKWTADELMSSAKCYNCRQDIFNTWCPCIRQSCQINLHPEFTTRSRQIWFLIMQILKFTKTADKPNENDFKYDGEHQVEHEIYYPQHLNRKLDPNVPKHLQVATIVRRGNCHGIQCL